MTLAAEQAKGSKRLAWAFEVELLYRIEGATWTQDGTYTNCWWMDHLAEGEPSRVRQPLRSTHAITTLTERATLTLCNSNASSWYYDPGTGRLYVRMSGSDSPATASKYYVSSHFWRYFVTEQYPLPDTLYDPAGKFIPPRLIVSIPEYSQEASDFGDGYTQTWSKVNIGNADGEYDAAFLAVDEDFRAHAYIWSMCPCYLKVGARGDAYSAFTTICRGRTGATGWDDASVEVRVEDQVIAEE